MAKLAFPRIFAADFNVPILSRTQELTLPSKSLAAKLKAVLELTKARLNLSVVYSAVAGYLLGATTISWWSLFLLSVGGYLVVGAANGFNQILERDRDALMQRTKNRPLPTQRLSVVEALLACTAMAFAGLWLLWIINPLTFIFGAFALFVYVLIYTPLKAVGPIAVFVGAFPGAIPALLGWVAATNNFGIEPGYLFAVQFIWQFTHFWAIAWIADEDYKKAGYILLPSGSRDRKSITQILLYTSFLIPLSILPAIGLTGSLSLSPIAAMLVAGMGAVLLYKAIALARDYEISSARKLMIFSIVYLPVVQVVLVIDKFI